MKAFTKSFFLGVAIAWLVGWSTHAMGCAYDGGKTQTKTSEKSTSTAPASSTGFGNSSTTTAQNAPKSNFDDGVFNSVGTTRQSEPTGRGSWRRN